MATCDSVAAAVEVANDGGTLRIDDCLSARTTAARNVRGGELQTGAGAAGPRAAVAISTKRTNEKRCAIRTWKRPGRTDAPLKSGENLPQSQRFIRPRGNS